MSAISNTDREHNEDPDANNGNNSNSHWREAFSGWDYNKSINGNQLGNISIVDVLLTKTVRCTHKRGQGNASFAKNRKNTYGSEIFSGR